MGKTKSKHSRKKKKRKYCVLVPTPKFDSAPSVRWQSKSWKIED